MPCDLEEAIVQTAVPDFFYKLLFGCGIILVETCVGLERHTKSGSIDLVLEKSRIGGASPALGMLLVVASGEYSNCMYVIGLHAE